MKISIIGAGAMGGAIAEGLLNQGFSGNDLMVSDPSEAVRTHFSERGAQAVACNATCAAFGDVVMVVVKPWLVETVASGIVGTLDYTRQTLVVIAAGVPSTALHSMFDKEGVNAPIVMVIPNIAVAIAESMSFVVDAGASPERLATVTDIFDTLGTTLITEERLLGAGTTLASCGIAYAMRYIRAAVEGGVELGFKAAEAQKIVVQTVKGAAGLLSQPRAHPESEIDKVTTPGGVTIRGLNEMEHAGFTSAVIRGLKAGLKA